MRTLVWQDALRIGHPRIDSEHERLVELAGRIEDLVGGRQSVDGIQRECGAFLDLLKSHCAFEETLLRKLPLSYVDRIDAHIFDHRFLIIHAEDLAERLCAGKRDIADLADLSKTVMRLMRELLVDDVELVGGLLREGKMELGSHLAPFAPLPITPTA